MSAILMDEDYYKFTINNSEQEDGISRANEAALICLKAKAYLENKRLKAEGKPIQTRDVVKHKYDVFRLVFLLAEADIIETPDSIYSDLKLFEEVINGGLPDAAIFDQMRTGAPVNMTALFEQFKRNFRL